MADLADRWEDNAPGRWYVDQTCILCSLCSEIAPRNFRASDDGDHDVVYQQPRTPAEVELTQAALEQCPVEAIGRNG